MTTPESQTQIPTPVPPPISPLIPIPSPVSSINPQSINKIKEILTCSLCSKLFYQPLTLHCQETFCRPCLKNYSNSLYGGCQWTER